MQNNDYNRLDVNTKWMTLKGSIKESAEQHVGYEARRPAKKPWIPEEMLSKLMGKCSEK